MITERYRKDYIGEFIVTKTAWAGGKKRVSREWIPNTIENNHISNRAACIGSAVDANIFDFTILQNHKGGLLGSLKLQTYGTGEIAQKMRLDFIVERDDDALQSLIDQHFYKNNVIYTTPRRCMDHPGVFHPIPYNPGLVQPLILPYLAAFDGHKEVFLLGYTDIETVGQNDWADQLAQLLTAYSSTKFYQVGLDSFTPDVLKQYSNFEHMGYRDFITHCDI
jgi:hypothetical protein